MGEKKKSIGAARAVALVAVSAATLECGKLALVLLPNIEIVTLLCALYGYVFGVYGVLSAAVFVCIEPFLFGFGPWVISYFLYWPFVALAFFALAKLRVKNRFALTGAALLLTLWFSVLTSLVDVGLFTGSYEKFFYRFGVYYLRGIVFYAIELACNAVLFPTLFVFLAKKLAVLKRRFFAEKNAKIA